MSSTTLQIAGLEVLFPFQPYPAQVEYMESVIKALDTGANALLESPTGTGKTLCLLCSTLAWALRRKQLVPALLRHTLTGDQTAIPQSPYKVVYCSRTHAQLAQVIKELKCSAYKGKVTMALLGAREHMCVNSEVTRLPSAQAQRSMCSALRADKSCRFFRSLQMNKDTAQLEEEYAIHDMEDLVTHGKRNGFCPYYYERDNAKEADIVFAPYNYIIDPVLRKQLPFELKNCILIVDEAHNLPSALSAACCLDLLPIDVTNAIHDCTRAVAMQRLSTAGAAAGGDTAAQHDGDLLEQEFASLKILLCRFEAAISTEVFPERAAKHSDVAQGSGKRELVRPGAYMLEFLASTLITPEVFEGTAGLGSGISEAMTKAVTLLSESERPAAALGRVQQFLASVFANAHASGGAGDSTRFVIQEEGTVGGTGSERPTSRRTLGFWKLDSGEELSQLAVLAHSLLLTSGTLSPLDHFAAELGTDFEVRLKGSHVIQPDQVLGCVLCKGPGGERLNSSYALRNSVSYRMSLGMTAVNMARVTPGGMLIFFPSYSAMNSAVDLWRAGAGAQLGAGEKTVWGLLSAEKPIFVEPPVSGDLKAVVTTFQKTVDGAPRRGAVLLAVCRGKVSEGIDFADHHGRCVVVTGIPFANHTDLFVRLKREYISQISSQRPLVNGKPFTGDDWYRNEAMRTVNQCIGRVIRHKGDYGVVLLADERFGGELRSLSDWVGRRTSVCEQFRDGFAAVSRFFLGRRSTVSEASSRTKAVSMAVDEGSANSARDAVSAEVPDSALKAREFAEARVRQDVEEQQRQQRRRLENASETPSLTARDGMNTSKVCNAPPHPTATASGPTTGTIPGAPAVPKMQRQTLASLPPPVPSVGPVSSTIVGASSREFCAYLKERLSGSSYSAFRKALGDIAMSRALFAASPQTVEGHFASIVSQLCGLFREASPSEVGVLLKEFGRHIPEELRPLYASVTRRFT